MNQPFDPDFSQANTSLDELVALSNSHGFNLFEFLRLFSEAGAPTFVCEVDNEPTITTGRRIVRYKLSEGLVVVLKALRTRNVNENDVKIGPGMGGSCSPRDGSSPGHFVTSP